MRWSVLLLGAGLLGLARPAPALEPVWRIAAQEGVPPKWLSSGQPTGGLCSDILAAMSRLDPGLQFSGSQRVWSVPMIERGLETGQLDLACALLDTERRREIAWRSSRPVYQVRHRVAARMRDTARPENLADLAALGALVATPRGASYVDQLRAAGVQVDDSSGDNALNLQKVLNGRVRYLYLNELSLHWLIHDAQQRDQLRILPTVFREEPIYFWTSRKLPAERAARLDRAISQLDSRGELARIYQSYFQTD